MPFGVAFPLNSPPSCAVFIASYKIGLKGNEEETTPQGKCDYRIVYPEY